MAYDPYDDDAIVEYDKIPRTHWKAKYPRLSKVPPPAPTTPETDALLAKINELCPQHEAALQEVVRTHDAIQELVAEIERLGGPSYAARLLTTQDVDHLRAVIE